MKLELLYFLLIPVFIISCNNKDEEEPILHYKICECMYPYIFDAGSYWVYESANTNILDSIVVGSLSEETYYIPHTTPGQGSNGIIDYVLINYFSSAEGIYSENVFADEISRGFLEGGFVFLSSDPGQGVQNAIVEGIVDSLLIENEVYRNVRVMKIFKDHYISEDCKFYYVDSVGVVRKEILTGDSVSFTWNLLRFSTTLHVTSFSQ
jgi:hypothetical protein